MHQPDPKAFFRRAGRACPSGSFQYKLFTTFQKKLRIFVKEVFLKKRTTEYMSIFRLRFC